jgi:gliding motility-associated-like protein
VLITVAPAIDARDDGPFFVKNDSVLTIDILGNDRYGGIPSVRILSESQYGIAEWDGSRLRYLSGVDELGTDEIQYELCTSGCLSCDTAILRITVTSDGSICDLVDLPDNIFPEGITPNGDGYNDWLEFIVVDPATCPFEYRQSELIIYNRWGDRVFEQSPYENKWQGTTGQGRELPSGVYYYVLKINREEPFVRFGTVTILKE